MPAKKKKPTYWVTDNEWVEIAWKGQYEECCGCGLRHRVDFRVAENGKLQFKAVQVKS